VTVFDTGPAAITADFYSGDIGYVKKALGHYVENTGTSDLVFMEVFRADRFEEISLSDWLAHSPPRDGCRDPQPRTFGDREIPRNGIRRRPRLTVESNRMGLCPGTPSN
jgi:hypothetical protein